jgi:purine-binding chemotaxis protein CheW
VNDVRRSRLDASALRHAFDQSFAAPIASVERADFVDLLAITVGGHGYVLALSELSGVHGGRKVVSIPSPLPELLGVAAFRGSVVPVYDLAAVLGHRSTAETPWLALAKSTPPIGLGFEALASHLRVDRSDCQSGGTDSGSAATRGVVATRFGLRPLIDVISIVSTITRRAADAAPSKEYSNHVR